MAEIPVKLTDWAQAHINTLVQATGNDFDSAFDNFIATDAQITFNGNTVSRDDYKAALKKATNGEVSATVNFLGSVEFVTLKISPEVGTAGIFYTFTINLNPPIDGLPQAVTDNSSLNLIVKNQPIGTPPPGQVPFDDLRRAFTVNHVQATEKTLL